MAIIRSANTTGAKANSTYSGNISLDHGQGELVSYQTDSGGNKYQAYKMDAQGIHYYNELGVEITKIAPDGTHYYNNNGNLLCKIAPDGTYYYDNSGNLLCKVAPDGTYYYDASGNLLTKIAPNGTHYYDASGHLLTKISVNGFDYYDANGITRINIGASGAGMIRIEMFDTDGTPRTWLGQSPADGDQVAAVSVSGENVETNLGGVSLLSQPVLLGGDNTPNNNNNEEII